MHAGDDLGTYEDWVRRSVFSFHPKPRMEVVQLAPRPRPLVVQLNPTWCRASQKFIDRAEMHLGELAADPNELDLTCFKAALFDQYRTLLRSVPADHRRDARAEDHLCLQDALHELDDRLEDLDLKVNRVRFRTLVAAQTVQTPNPSQRLSGIILGEEV